MESKSTRLEPLSAESVEQLVEDNKYENESQAIRELVRFALDNKHPNY